MLRTFINGVADRNDISGSSGIERGSGDYHTAGELECLLEPRTPDRIKSRVAYSGRIFVKNTLRIYKIL